MIKPILTNEEKIETTRKILSTITPKGERFLGPHVKTTEGYISMQLYPNSNEDLAFIRHLNPEGKHCLTVGSSLDQALTLMAMGAASVDVLDVNPFTSNFFELKKQTILNLNQAMAKAFLIYFPTQKFFMNKGTYEKKIQSRLMPTDQQIWDMVTGSANKMNFFRLEDFRLSIPPYLSDRLLFLNLKKRLANHSINFYNIPLANASIIPKTYDIVLLSNVGDWYKTKSRFIRDVKNLERILHSESLVQVGYQWSESAPKETRKALDQAFGTAIKDIQVKRHMPGGVAQILDIAEYLRTKPTLVSDRVSGEDE